MTTLNRNFVVKNGIEVGTTANVGSTLGVTGATTLANTLAVTGNTTLSNTLTVTGLASFNGGVALGDSTSDQIAITATVNTDIIPTTTGADSLGNTSNRWLNVFANNLTLTTNVSTAGITTTTIAVSGLASLNGGVALGDATSDQISITGVVNTNIIPSATGSKDLGNTSTRWANVWANNLTVTTNVAAQGITATDMVLSGNLTVSGTTTFINTTNLDVGDNIVTLNADLPGATAPTENAGFTVNRGSAANVSFLWDETADKWTLSNTSLTGTLEVSTSVNTASYTVGSNFTANTTGVYTTGAVNAASYAIGSNFTVSSTNLNHTGTINAATFSVGSSFTANDSATVFNVSSSGNAVRITQTGTGHALVVEDEANPDATPFIIDANGRVVSGHTTVDSMWYTGSNVPRVWSIANTTNRAGFGSVNYGGPAGLSLFRSGGTTIGTEAIVASGDLVGSITYGAYDGATSGALEVSRIDAYVDGTPGTGSMPSRLTFSTTASGAASATERMRIDSSGQVGIGGVPSAGRTLSISKAITGATGSYGSFAFGTIQSDVTSEAVYYRTAAVTAAASFTVGSVKHYEANQGTFGAGSTVTNQFGYLAGSSLTGAGSNYGFYGNIPAAAGRWNFYAAGTANNYFAGQTEVANTFAAGNTTITGFANISSSVNAVSYNINTTFIANTTGVYHTGLVNAASYNINTTFIANTTGVYHTGTANLATIGTTNIYVGNSTVNTVIANGSITINGVNVNSAITSNADAAYTNAASYADTAAATAYTNATNFAANATNISSGTLADARLSANVLLVSDSKTLSGNLIVSGTYFNPSANTNLLGNTTARWVLAANTGDFSGAVTMSSTLAVTGNVTGADATMTRMNLKDTAWSWNDSNTVNTIDYTNGSVQRWAPAAASNPTLTITNWPASGTLGELLIEGVALASAGTVSLNATPTWNILKSDGSYSNTFSGSGVTLTTGTDWLLLWTRDGGTNIYLKVMR